MLDGMSDSIQGSSIENLHSREVDRQSPTGLIFSWSAPRNRYGQTERGGSEINVSKCRAVFIIHCCC